MHFIYPESQVLTWRFAVRQVGRDPYNSAALAELSRVGAMGAAQPPKHERCLVNWRAATRFCVTL